ncbi:Response regulator receiver domain-containing protein [Arthrobacter sp. 9AX]|uniref:response regulator transcription factor n=1 Tax=Arthrobacter sp. 9AX TaxID=2653131 RepID=UPI0012F15B43|nr:response regulator [Arthrobacter sp. 9AX]VXC08427.1 Response regulator receiver domain-containing protein [Arthrobacter sp. 9AX]
MENTRVCLVVEDNDDIRGLITFVLKRAGFEVRAVSTGAEGIAAAADPAVSLVTLDLGLPDMDGHVVARAVRALSKAPILFLTARSENDDVLAGMASGAAAYLTKPFHPKELQDLAEQLCPAPVASAPLSQVPHIPGKSLC